MDVPVEDPEWPGPDSPQRRQRILDALKRLLLRESQVQALLLVVEDLHWIDSETQAFLDSLVESLPSAQILLLVGYRPEYQHGWVRRSPYTHVPPDPLPPPSGSACPAPRSSCGWGPARSTSTAVRAAATIPSSASTRSRPPPPTS